MERNLDVGLGTTVEHTYADGDASVDVSLWAADEDSYDYFIDQSLEVLNVPPQITLGGDFGATEGAQFTLSFSASDPGYDEGFSNEWSISWGDGAAETYSADINGGTLSHIYSDGDSWAIITVGIADADGSYETSAYAIRAE